MATRLIDNRQDEADRTFGAWVQRGADPTAVKALLPALVGPPEAAQAAREWLGRNAFIGTGAIDPYTDPDGSKAEAVVVIVKDHEFAPRAKIDNDLSSVYEVSDDDPATWNVP